MPPTCCRHDDHRHLLPHLAQRREKLAKARCLRDPEGSVAQLQLMKLDLHCARPCAYSHHESRRLRNLARDSPAQDLLPLSRNLGQLWPKAGA